MEKSIKERAQEKLNTWKNSLKELYAQLNIESDKAIDEFENQKENLKNWIDGVSEKLKNAENIGEEKSLKLKHSLDELRVQAALGKAETKEALKEQHHNLNLGIHNLKQYISEVYADSKDTAKDLSDDAIHKLENYSTNLDTYKLKAQHLEEEAKGKWEEKKKELSEKMDILKAKIEEGKDIGDDKWDDFSAEIAEAWKHVRNAFKN